ncbi:hypothetical protein BO82DRAFT_355316 [Aspergillus uvarum CBS 121591]|uniref:HMG box domain-containing protein n=1 Tax=Aspergillus uvarum CBS 121591 TaxID=1448315 RepID=A0A319C3R2_9EURO|nr:hypothetical protein BO82DRAFT_355316 [Aspergillus uvarum CBS 121591]PYH80606.1 hypothetical protein BO82DRAFT_355316 [Aspergillus uvarum CBS 121591]
MRSKNRDPKKEKPMPCIIQPLSVLTKNMARISIKDIESWVHRSSETRIQEVQRRKGRVTRPMNSFMLYRSAYAERTKQWLAQNDHRLVSEISGKSWKLEPREVRQKYEHLAEIEKHNHLKAHPDYRFSPTKIKRNSKGVGGEQPFKIVSESNSGLLPAFALNTATEISNSGHCWLTSSTKISSDQPIMMPQNDLLIQHISDLERTSFQNTPYDHSSSTNFLAPSYYNTPQFASSAIILEDLVQNTQPLIPRFELPSADQVSSLHKVSWQGFYTI